MADTNMDWMAFLRNAQQQQPMGMGGIQGMGGPMGQQPPPPMGMPGQPPPGSMGPGPGATPPMQPPPPSGPTPMAGGINPNAPEVFGAPTGPAGPGRASGDNQMAADLYSRLGAIEPQQKEYTRERAMADQLRQGAGMPGMRGAGRTQQAAHPLEFLSSLAHAGGAAYKGAGADTKEKEYDRLRAEAFQGFRTGQGFK